MDFPIFDPNISRELMDALKRSYRPDEHQVTLGRLWTCWQYPALKTGI